MTPDRPRLRMNSVLSHRVANRSSEIEKLSDDLGEAYEQLTLIYKTVRHLGASFELDPIARQLVDRALEAAPATSAALYLADGRTKNGFEIVASRGVPIPKLASGSVERLASASIPQFLSGELARTELDPSISGTCEHLLAAPLEAGGRTLGLLVILRADSKRFTTVEAKLLGALCNVTAVAVANWQHYRAIQNEREMLYGVIREIGDGIIIANEHWTARHTNQAARRLLGVTRSDEEYDALWKLRAFRLSVPESELREGAAATLEFRADSPDPRRPLSLACRVFRAQFGAAAEPVLVLQLRDVTRERSEAEAQRDFMSLASHKLRTPLTKIEGLLPILGDRTASAEVASDAVEGVHSGARELAALIDGILEFVEYRRTDHAQEEVALPPIVADAIARVIERRGCGPAVNVTVADGVPRVLGSARMLRRLVESLVDNAMKFSPQGASPIEVRLDPLLEKGGEPCGVLLVVRDHGEGMTPELLERAFLPFSQRDLGFTGQDDGAGLGLLLAREIANRHGGRLYATSELGNGSVFFAELDARGFVGVTS